MLSKHHGLGVMLAGALVVLPVSLAAQSIPAKGTSTTFDVATWNIEWFGAANGPADDELQFQNVLYVMRATEIDLWAVQEIADDLDFFRLVDSLGAPYNGFLATESGQQRIGFIFNEDLVSPRSIGHVLTGVPEDPFAGRPPLELVADVAVADSTRTLTFITLHMKCCGSTEDHERRLSASIRLKNHIDFTSRSDDPVVILGDFNDELDDSITGGRDTPYRNFLDDPNAFRFTTFDLDAANLATFCSSSLCGSGSTLDHILITNELYFDVEGGTTDRIIELVDAIPGYVQSTSDHLPVFARIRHGIRTGLDDTRMDGSERLRVFPNPSNGQTYVELAGAAVSTGAVVRVYDTLGRSVMQSMRTIGASDLQGRSRFALDTTDLSPGVYVLLVSNDRQSWAGHLVVTQ